MCLTEWLLKYSQRVIGYIVAGISQRKNFLPFVTTGSSNIKQDKYIYSTEVAMISDY